MTKDTASTAKRTTLIKKQKKPALSGAERAKNFRARQKVAFQNKTMNRKQTNKYIKEKKRRTAKNKPKACGTSSSKSSSSITWMNDAKTIQGIGYKLITTHMRHACTPSFVGGRTDPVTAKDTGNREVYFLDDNNRWQHWIDKKKSSIAGFGIFAARTFKAGAICTRYCGKKTSSSKATMFKKSKGYVFKFQTKKHKVIFVAPDLNKSYLYGHYLNHSAEPNCAVDRYTGIITTIFQVKKGDELTINYGKDYDWSE